MTRIIPKWLLALICAVVVVLAVVAVPAYAVTALAPGVIAAQESVSGTTDDGWAWKANDQGTAVTLTGYTGTSLAPSVPAQVAGLPVTGAIVNRGAGAPAITSINLGEAAGSLTQLKVWGCALTALDVSACTNLSKLIVSENDLASLKLGTLPKLTWLQCSGNELTSLDISGCAALQNLRCDNNKISALDITKCTALEYVDCHENKLTDLRPGACLNLNDLFCYDNYIVDRIYDLTQRYGAETKVVMPQHAVDEAGGADGKGDGGSSESGSSETAKMEIQDVVLDHTVYTYDGSAKTPGVTVKGAGGAVLSNGTDYKLTYGSGRVNAGAYKVTVKGAGKYTGTFTSVFVISPAPLGKLALSKSKLAYNGKAQAPGITVKGAQGSTALARGKDYTVTYSTKHLAVGVHGITVNGTGNYTGSLSAQFTIVPAKAAVKSVTVGKQKLTVKLGGKASAFGGGTFNIAYKAKGAKSWQYASGSGKSKVVKKLKQGKKYQVKVQVKKKVAGVWYKSAWSAVKTTKKVK